MTTNHPRALICCCLALLLASQCAAPAAAAETIAGDCTFLEETFQQVAGPIEAAVQRPDQRVAFRCDGGCRELPAGAARTETEGP